MHGHNISIISIRGYVLKNHHGKLNCKPVSCGKTFFNHLQLYQKDYKDLHPEEEIGKL